MAQIKAENLWDRAFQTLDDGDKNVLQNADKQKVLTHLLRIIQAKQEICLQRRWKFKKPNGKQVIIRDLFEKVARWVDKFKEVGDVAMQYDPSHAALPWAAIRMLLQLSVNDVQIFGAMAEGVEATSNLIARYAIVENLYLQERSDGRAQLRDSVTKLYTAILLYLSRAYQYYQQSTGKRARLAVIQTAEQSVDIFLRRISEENTRANDIRQIVDAECQRKQSETLATMKLENIDYQHRLKTMLEALEKPITRTSGQLSDLHDRLQRETRQEILGWISSIPISTYHKTLSDSDGLLSESGQWLVHKPEFVEWKNKSTVLSTAGSGKTKLVTTVVRDFLEEMDASSSPAPLAYFYCTRDPAETRRGDPEEILRSFVRQLSTSKLDQAIREPVVLEYNKRKKDAKEYDSDPLRLNIAESVQVILKLTEKTPAIIILDALDECHIKRRHELMEALVTIAHESASLVKVLVSSRDDTDIKLRLERFSNIQISAENNEDDIKRFVLWKITRAIENKSLLNGTVSTELKQQIINSLINGAQGMFLWVDLQIECLSDRGRMKLDVDVRSALGKLPKTLASIYDKIHNEVLDVESTSCLVAKKALTWLLYAQRPLTTKELIVVTSSEFEAHNLQLTRTDVLNLCCNLVIWDAKLDVFRFSHLSVREYLENRMDYASSCLHRVAIKDCLKFCKIKYQDIVDRGRGENSSSIFLDYAATYWAVHYSKISLDERRGILNSEVVGFFFDGNQTNWIFTEWTKDATAIAQSLERFDVLQMQLSAASCQHGSPLFTATIFGLLEIVEKIDDLLTMDWDEKNDQGASGLYLAARFGHIEVVRFLLRKGANPNAKGGAYGTPLQAASFTGHAAIVQVLLEADADVFLTGAFDNAFQAGFAGRHESIVLLLLQNGADISAQGLHETLLLMASYGGYESIVKLLLATHDDPYSEEERCNALQSALYVGRRSVVETLIPEIVDINLQGGYFGNALTASCFGGHYSMVSLILSKGADVQSQGRFGTALRAASVAGHELIVALLLENGADILAQDQFGGALQAASFKGHESIARLLLEKGAEVNKNGGYYGNALQSAIVGGNLNVVELLVNNGANIKASGRYRNALHAAIEAKNEAIEQLLLENGANVDSPIIGPCRPQTQARRAVKPVNILRETSPSRTHRKEPGNLMQKHPTEDQHVTVRELITDANYNENGRSNTLDSNDNGDINQVDYHTALYAAAENGNLGVAQFLLERSFTMSGQDGQSRSILLKANPTEPADSWGIVASKPRDALRAAIEGGHYLLVQALLRQGDSNTMSRECFDEFMHAASCCGSLNILLRALYQEMQGMLPTRLLRNALFLAIRTGNLDVIVQLIEYGADTNSNCEKYGGVFDFALKCGHMAVVQFLLDKGSKFKGPKEHWESTLNLLTRIKAPNRGSNVLRNLNPRYTDPIPAEGQATIRLLVENGSSSASEANLREQVLQEAASQGFIEVIQLLVDKGVNINACNDEKKGDALLRASWMGHDLVVQFLLDSGADAASSHANVACFFDGCHKTRHTPLDAVLDRFLPPLRRRFGPDLDLLSDLSCSDINIACSLLEKDIELNVHDERIGILLQYAAREGNSSFIQTLLAKGVDVNMNSLYHGNALQAASRAGNVAMTDLLLKSGANVHAEGGEYLNALNAAISGGYTDVVELLLNNGASLDSPAKLPFDNVVQFACSQGNEAVMMLLIRRGANVNMPGRLPCNTWERHDLRSLLHIAVLEGHIKIIHLLIDSGANINATDGIWGTALQSACYRGKLTAVGSLLERGADLCCQGAEYGSPLYVAAYQGHQTICQLLLEWGADLNAPGGRYGSVLQASCVSRKTMLVQHLLDAGADVNTQNGEYGNALQAACVMNSPKIVQLLLDYGADPCALGKHDGALEAAAYEGHNRVVQLLLRRDDIPAKRYENALQAVLNGVAAKPNNIYYDSPMKGYGICFHLLVEHGADVRILHQDHLNTLQLKPNTERPKTEFEMAADCITRVIETANEKKRKLLGDPKIEDAQISEVKRARVN